jgi:hypothetical protein
MPNGGVPMHMMIRPASSSSHAVNCRGAELMVSTEADLTTGKDNVSPLLRLSREEALVLERSLRYWLDDHDDGPIYRGEKKGSLERVDLRRTNVRSAVKAVTTHAHLDAVFEHHTSDREGRVAERRRPIPAPLRPGLASR